MLDEAAIYQRLMGVFASVFFDDTIELGPETTADDVEGWDSVNHINLIVAAELEFGMQFDTAELEALHKVGDMVAVIRKKAA